MDPVANTTIKGHVMKKTLAVIAAAAAMAMMNPATSGESASLVGQKLDSGLGSMVYGESLDSGLGELNAADLQQYFPALEQAAEENPPAVSREKLARGLGTEGFRRSPHPRPGHTGSR